MSKAINLSTIFTIWVIIAAAAASLDVQVKLTESPELSDSRFDNIKGILKSAQDEIRSASMRIAFEDLDNDNFEDIYREEVLRILEGKVVKINTQMIKDLSNLELHQVIDYLLNFFTELTLTSRLFGNANLNLKALLDSLTLQLVMKFDQIDELQNLKSGEADYLKARLNKFVRELVELNGQNELTGDLLEKNLEIVEQVLQLIHQISGDADFDFFLDELLGRIGEQDNDLHKYLKLVIAQKRKPVVELEGEVPTIIDEDRDEEDFDEEGDIVGQLEEIKPETDLIDEIESDFRPIEQIEKDPVGSEGDRLKKKNQVSIKSNLKQPTNIHQARTSKLEEQKPLIKPVLSNKSGAVIRSSQVNRTSVINQPNLPSTNPRTQINTNGPRSSNLINRNTVVKTERTSVINNPPKFVNNKVGQPKPTLKIQTGGLELEKDQTTVQETIITLPPKEKKQVELVPDIVLEDIFANVNYISPKEDEIIGDLINIEEELKLNFVEMPSFDDDTKNGHLNNPNILKEFLKTKDFSCLNTKYYFSHNIVTFYMKSLIFRNSLFNEEIATQIRELKFKKEGTTALRMFSYIKEQLWNRFEASILLNFKAKAMDHGLDHPHNFNLLKEEAYRYVKECLLPSIKKIFQKKMNALEEDEVFKKIAQPILEEKAAKKYYTEHSKVIIDGFLDFLIKDRIPDLAKFIEEFIVMQTSKRYSKPENWEQLFDDIKQYVITNKVESRDIEMVKSRIEVFKIVKAALEKRRQIFQQKKD